MDIDPDGELSRKTSDLVKRELDKKETAFRDAWQQAIQEGDLEKALQYRIIADFLQNM